MREKPKDNDRLLHILEAIDTIFEFLEGKTFAEYQKDKILKFSIVKNLEIIGEASYKLTEDFRKNNPEIEWDDIILMRHILVHGYYKIKDEIVWATIETDLLPLKSKIIKLIKA